MQSVIKNPLLLMLSIAPLAAIAERHTEMDEIVVTSPAEGPSTTILGLEAARKEIGRTPGGVNIVDAAEYRRGRVNTMQDVLGFSPGVLVQPRFGSDEARLSIRGSGIQRTFHLRGIKLLQDSVPINLADGGGDFQALDGLSARYVEVFRGANALQFGSTTLGGAVNFVSPRVADAPRYHVRGEVGSFDYFRAQGATTFAAGISDGFLSLTHTQQDGFRDQSEQDNIRMFGHVGFHLADAIETRFFFNYTDTDSELPGNLTKTQLNTNPKQANPNNLANDWQRNFDLFRLSNKTTFSFDAGRVELYAFYANKDLFHPIFLVLDIESDDYGGGTRFITERKLFGRENILTFGGNVHGGVADDNRFINMGGIPGFQVAQLEQTSLNYDIFIEDQWFVIPQLALVAGAQWTRAERELVDGFGDADFDETYTNVSPKFGARYLLNDDIQFFANISGSFEPPSFGELSGGQVINVVRAQEAVSFEIGSRGQHERFGTTWDIVYYYADVDDELLSLNDELGQPLGTVSADSTIHQGIELGLRNSIGPVDIQQIYLWNDFTFDSDPVFGNNDLAGVPEHYYRGEFLFNFPWDIFIGPVVEWVPLDYFVDHANTLEADSYAILGLKGGLRTDNGLQFFIEGRNLFDKTYAATTGVIADAGGADSAQFLPGDGASVFVGVEWEFHPDR